MIMKTKNTTFRSEQSDGEELQISHEKLIALVSSIYVNPGEYPNPEEDPHPRPGDPVIRKISRRFFGPFPEPWRSQFDLENQLIEIIAERHPAIYGVLGDGPFHRVALNPQPL